MKRTFNEILNQLAIDYPQFLVHQMIDENGKRHWKATHLENTRLTQVGTLQKIQRFIKKYENYSRYN